GFTVPLDRWFATDLQTVVRDRVLHGPLARLGRFRMPAVEQAISDHFSGRANHGSLVWALLVIGSWTERYA
ncbi:MAG TPA: asparagine synthase-related protein, partial [Nitrospirales bacterium]|nr:asparagine synthase-related protein [Nitrospirales bacterium]